jgi:hypothetical protein
MTLRDIFKVMDSESEVDILNVDTDIRIMKGIRGMIDMVCSELDWEVTHITPDTTTKIWVKRPTTTIEGEF